MNSYNAQRFKAAVFVYLLCMTFEGLQIGWLLTIHGLAHFWPCSVWLWSFIHGVRNISHVHLLACDFLNCNNPVGVNQKLWLLIYIVSLCINLLQLASWSYILFNIASTCNFYWKAFCFLNILEINQPPLCYAVKQKSCCQNSKSNSAEEI